MNLKQKLHNVHVVLQENVGIIIVGAIVGSFVGGMIVAKTAYNQGFVEGTQEFYKHFEKIE